MFVSSIDDIPVCKLELGRGKMASSTWTQMGNDISRDLNTDEMSQTIKGETGKGINQRCQILEPTLIN